MIPSPPTETEIREMRDKVFGHPSSDKNWEGCRENWMKPGATKKWLQDYLEEKDD